jgi:prostamide/prostaglandin F2alpha synthase
LDVQETLSKKLADIVLPDGDGREIRLGSLWEKQPAVIVFLRHYG